jgi:hypothetical protein
MNFQAGSSTAEQNSRRDFSCRERIMNALAMRQQRTTFVLEIWLLPRPYRTSDNLQSASRVTYYESLNGFGTFHVGDSFSHGFSNQYLGTIQHVHHRVGQEEGDEVVHRTLLYLFKG